MEVEVTVQKICRICKDEKDVRAILDEVWKQPSRAPEVLVQTHGRNRSVFDFEKMLA